MILWRTDGNLGNKYLIFCNVNFALLSVGATNTRPAVRWTDQAERDDFVSRYERITAATDDFTVFKSNLPGKHAISGNLKLSHWD